MTAVSSVGGRGAVDNMHDSRASDPGSIPSWFATHTLWKHLIELSCVEALGKPQFPQSLGPPSRNGYLVQQIQSWIDSCKAARLCAPYQGDWSEEYEYRYQTLKLCLSFPFYLVYQVQCL